MRITDQYIKNRVEKGERVVLRVYGQTLILDKEYYECVKDNPDYCFTDWKVIR